ncbi:hypothetical protein [Brevibacillus migulae]|uniref:hypothetical protein n=1 Tax=Brevibacillus migulae TaxID=1644114 RepID=UPI00106DEA94|nr:hypothetical protein [Brevibacillus migulae]
MLTKWIAIHESYGLPRAAQALRLYLENQGIRVKITTKEKRSIYVYQVLVAAEQKERATLLLKQFRDR